MYGMYYTNAADIDDLYIFIILFVKVAKEIYLFNYILFLKNIIDVLIPRSPHRGEDA